MLQVVITATVLFAALAVLVASYRVGHRLFIRVSSVVATIAAAVLGTLVYQGLRPPLLADTDAVNVSLVKAHPVEIGYRLEFVASNQGQGDTRQLAFKVALKGCLPPQDEGGCTDWGEASVDMPLHLPPDGQYPFARVLEYEPLPDGLSPVWDITVTRVELYRN